MIPKQTTDFLDRYGIEHSVIHEARYRQVAARHDYSFATEIREIDQNRSEGKLGAERPPATSGFSFSTTAKKTGDEKDFLKRCDEEGKHFFSALFERQRASTGKTKITWDHESGFSLQFYFARFGYVPFVWGFPDSNLEGKGRKERLEFPFHFAGKKAPVEFINSFGTALSSIKPLKQAKNQALLLRI